MNGKHLKGLTVISIADGERLGTIDRVLVDPHSKQVIGFAVSHGGLLNSDAPAVIDADDIHSLGPDAVTLSDRAAIRGDQTTGRQNDLMDLDDLLKLRVVTEGGTLIGDVADVQFDEKSFAFREIDVSPGFFKNNQLVPISQVISIGRELVMVDNSVVAATPGSEATTDKDQDRRFVVGDVKE